MCLQQLQQSANGGERGGGRERQRQRVNRLKKGVSRYRKGVNTVDKRRAFVDLKKGVTVCSIDKGKELTGKGKELLD